MASSISTAGGIKSDPATWLDRYGDVLFRYAVARVQDQMVAEDLVQEALLAAFSAADSFKGGSTEQTWLVGILRHKVMDYLRKVTRERRLQTEWAEDAIEDNDSFDQYGHWRAEIDEWAAPEESLAQAEFWQAFDGCLGQLPEQLRALFALRELDGMDSDVLIETMNISSKNNLWVMLSRARQQIRKCLHAQWFKDR
jgi:RNA polymerase sigma-70 factor (ECF subfamily)